jgi:hypothetical protein
MQHGSFFFFGGCFPFPFAAMFCSGTWKQATASTLNLIFRFDPGLSHAHDFPNFFTADLVVIFSSARPNFKRCSRFIEVKTVLTLEKVSVNKKCVSQAAAIGCSARAIVCHYNVSTVGLVASQHTHFCVPTPAAKAWDSVLRQWAEAPDLPIIVRRADHQTSGIKCLSNRNQLMVYSRWHFRARRNGHKGVKAGFCAAQLRR